MTAYDPLAEHYDAGRIGYSNDVYNSLLGFGLTPRDHVLDVCCGTGLASKPLIENAFRVTGIDLSETMLAKAKERYPSASWNVGSAEDLPFQEGAFDAAISAQAFHQLDRTKAIAQMRRVVRPGGVIAIWWKLLMNDDPFKLVRDEVASSFGVNPPVSGLQSGFKEFYGGPLADQTLRVLPWRAMVSLADQMRYERSRKIVRDTFGKRANEYFERLEQRAHEIFGAGNPLLPLNYIQMLYMAHRPV